MYRLQSSYSITPSMIRNYVYCPVIPWINTHYNIYEPPTYSMEEGSEIDYEGLKEKICRDNECDGYVEKPVVDGGDVRGIIDLLVLRKRERIIVEIKKYHRKHYQHQIAQLKTYAEIYSTRKGRAIHRLLLVQEGDVVYDKRYEYEDKVETKKLIEAVKRVINSDKPPNIEPSSKCNSCWYKKICPVYRAYL